MPVPVSASSVREQDMGTRDNPAAFASFPLVTRGPLCAGLPVTDNPILIRIITVCVDAGNSHIFKELCRGAYNISKNTKNDEAHMAKG